MLKHTLDLVTRKFKKQCRNKYTSNQHMQQRPTKLVINQWNIGVCETKDYGLV
jgi:hypothetical protein